MRRPKVVSSHKKRNRTEGGLSIVVQGTGNENVPNSLRKRLISVLNEEKLKCRICLLRISKYGKIRRRNVSMTCISGGEMPNVRIRIERRSKGKKRINAEKDKRSSLRLISRSSKNGRRRSNSERLRSLMLNRQRMNTTKPTMSISVMWLSLSLVSMIRTWQQGRLVKIGIRASM